MAIAFGSSASLSGLFSARPAPDAAQVGRFYFATDTNDLYRDSGTAWVLIGTARTYKVYTALLTQSGIDAPVATVLKNTLGGTVVWTRSDTGRYIGTLADAFPLGKTAVSPFVKTSDGMVNGMVGEAFRNGDSVIDVSTFEFSTGTFYDDQLTDSLVSVIVYL